MNRAESRARWARFQAALTRLVRALDWGAPSSRALRYLEAVVRRARAHFAATESHDEMPASKPRGSGHGPN